ncbi:globin domain-containing protein [Streptomyces wuyuanensis]|uniref:globin domain-containing protein n=1 Tax=Streptomyces wuyuanensis TaxID=1196353 RepID=UPI00343F5112
MNTTNSDAHDEYHALLARQDARRLRQQLLGPAPRWIPPSEPAPHQARRGDFTGKGYGDEPADQQMIIRSIPLVSPFSELIDHLYEAMFERHPYLRGLFPDSMEFQRTHLAGAFSYLIENLHQPDVILAFCTRLGRDHRKLGVRPAHYKAFETALAEALRRFSGRGWTADMEQEWLRMLRFAVAAMVDGAEQALSEPACWHATVTSHQLRSASLAVLRVRTYEPYPYRAGQYASIQSPLLPNSWRPYVIACAPRSGAELEFHIRLVGSGGVSEALVARTRVGDTLRLGPAQGTVTLDGDPTRDVLIVAEGTGWATAKALLEELTLQRQPGRTAHLFLGARTLDDLYDTLALAGVGDGRAWLRVVPVIGESYGSVEGDPVAEAVARSGDWSKHLACVSGSPATVTATVRRLAAMNVPPGRIRHDPVTRPAFLPLSQ